MRTPEQVTHVAAGRRSRTGETRGQAGCVVTALAVVGALAIAVVAVVAVWIAVTGHSSGSAVRTPQASPASVPADLKAGESWITSVDLQAERLVRDGLELRNAKVTGSGGRLAENGSMTFRRLDLRGIVPYASVAEEAGSVIPGGSDVAVAPGPDGLVRVSTSVGAFGQDVPVTVDARVTAQDGQLAIEPVSSSDGGLVGAAAGLIPTIRRPVPGVPSGMALQQVEVTDAGFRVHVVGSDVTLDQ